MGSDQRELVSEALTPCAIYHIDRFMRHRAKAPNVAQFRLRADQAEKVIRQRATVTTNVILGLHAKERASERLIFKEDILRILRNGVVRDEPELTEQQEWKCNVVMRIKGQREAGAVTIILTDVKLFVKTVEWEDWRHG